MIYQWATLFGADDVTPIKDHAGTQYGAVVGDTITEATVTTDPAGPRPYLMMVEDYGSSEVNFRAGSSAIGQLTLDMLDARQVATDQATGFVTLLLADVGGIPQMTGHRLKVQQGASLATAITLLDGIIDSVQENESLASYRFVVKDIRERERKTSFFVASTTTSLLPGGSSVDWGLTHRQIGGHQFAGYLVKAIPPWKGTFRANHRVAYLAGQAGVIEIDQPVPPPGLNAWDRFNYWKTWTDLHLAEWQKYGAPSKAYGPNIDSKGVRFHGVALQWRPEGDTGPFTTLYDMPWYYEPQVIVPNTNVFAPTMAVSFKDWKVTFQPGILKWIICNGLNIPTDGQRVEFRVLSRGAPSEAAPILIEMPRGELLQRLYDGEYGSYPPGGTLDNRPAGFRPPIPYDAAAMADFRAKSGMARLAVTASKDDLRAWVEKNIYQPEGYAPWVDPATGAIVPLSGDLPDESVALAVLDNTNTAVEGSGWRMGSDNAINVVEFTYKRYYLTTVEADAAPMTGLKSVEEIVRYDNGAASLLQPEHLLSYEPETVSEATMDPTGASTIGSTNEPASKLAEKRAIFVLDRYSFGAPVLVVRCRRVDAQVEGLTAGRWCQVNLSWMPDFLTHRRGINRLMQVTSVHDISQAFREFTLEDAGPHGQPIPQPTITNLQVDADTMQVGVDLTALPVVSS